MELRLSRPALIEALERQGKDLDKLTNQEMQPSMCSRHVTYFFEPEKKHNLPLG